MAKQCCAQRRRGTIAAAALLIFLALLASSPAHAAGRGGTPKWEGNGSNAGHGGTVIDQAKPSTSAGDGGEEPPPLSLDEARKLTTGIDAQSAAAPPRSVADITAVLDREKPDPAKVAAARALADQAPPAGLTGLEGARYYYERGNAASELGRFAQSIEDMRKAVALIEPVRNSDPDAYNRILNALAIAESRAGDLRASIADHEHLAEFAAATPAIKGALIPQYYALVSAHLRLGHMAIAEEWLAKLEDLVRTTAWRARAKDKLNVFRSRYDWAKANILDAQGKYAESEAYLRRALVENTQLIEDAKQWNPPAPPMQFETSGDLIRREIAISLLRQGRAVDGEIMARQALNSQLRLRGRYANETVGALITLGNVVAAQGRNEDAEKLERAAIETLQAIGHGPDSYALNVARASLADVLLAEDRWRDALAAFDQIKAGIKDPDLLRVMMGLNLDYATAALRGGQSQVAVKISENALAARSSRLGDKHYGTAEARAIHAAALAAAGNQAGAAADFAAAMPALLEGARQTDEDSNGAGRNVRLQLILESYLSLLAKAGSAEAVPEAFRIADAARGRAVQRALAASAARAAVGDPALADLVRREQDASLQVAGLNKLIADTLTNASGQQDDAAIATLRKQVDQFRGARATIRAEIEKRFPDYINLIDPKPATVAETQTALEPGEALIATYVAEDQTYVWAVPKTGPVAFAPVALKRAELEAIVAQLRKAIEPRGGTLGDIAPFDVDLAYKLYTLLLKPVEAGWKGAKRLLVVSHGALGQLPLGLLVTQPAKLESEKPDGLLFARYKQVPWLVRETALAELPSVASLVALRGPRAGGRAAKPFVGFGDPWFSTKEATEARAARPAGTQVASIDAGSGATVALRGVRIHLRSVPHTQGVNQAELGLLPRLPDTAEEVREVALALHADPQADVFLGADASEATVLKTRLDDRRVVMFATHGLIPGDLDGLSEPALALSAPEVAGGGGDGLLTMSKILGLKLNADWVVLSACNTAAGNGAGAEAVSGLGLAFFYAGSRALIVSNWPVETTSARALTTAVFRREADDPGIARAEALREAMLALIDGSGYIDKRQNRALFSYAHPIFWAPFALVGDGGAPRTR